MEKERLFISPRLVRVDYVFRNTGKEPVTSEVGFPIPPMTWQGDDPGGPRGFADFRAWVDQTPAPVSKEVRAFVKDRDVTDTLWRAGVAIEEFGKFDPFAANPRSVDQIQKLPKVTLEELVRLGALERPPKDDPVALFTPAWEARVTFHWTQAFPPGVDVRIHHEYKPVTGFATVRPEELAKAHPDACVDEGTLREVERRVKAMKAEKNRYFYTRWVKYILTTANTWQTPIGDFELTVERPKGTLASICWDGPVEKAGADRFIARRKGFVPQKELEVLFLSFDGSF